MASLIEELPRIVAQGKKGVELCWDGKYGSVQFGARRPVEHIQLPFQPVESINSPRDKQRQLVKDLPENWPGGWVNRLIWGDNKYVIGSLLKEFRGKVNLIYIDPPFFTGADFTVKTTVGDEDVVKEPSIIEEKAYRDTWGKGELSVYLRYMYERLVLMKELLADNGSIYVHLDWHVGHYAKVMLDEIFGYENLKNEIIWHYDYGARPKGMFGKKHDTIFWYSKSNDWIFNTKAVLVPYESGMTEWRYTKGGQAGKKMPEGKVPSDVWDIKLNAMSLEHLGFDTQKPEDLLKRFILASSNPGDLVADFFCGSGTTGAVAEKLGRRWIMCDLSKFAIHVTRKRLLDIPFCKPFEISNLGKYERQVWQRDHLEAQQREYLRFILELHSAEPLSGYHLLHGRKGPRVVYVGAIDSPVTADEIRAVLEECKANHLTQVEVLGWDFEFGVHEPMKEEAAALGIGLFLKTIPREVMEAQAAEKQDIDFYELNYLVTTLHKVKRTVRIELKDFNIPNQDMIEPEVREKIKTWTDYIDYWAIDWDFKEDIFRNCWQEFRTRKKRTLAIQSPEHEYSKLGRYKVLVKVIDIFGNDTTKLLEVEVK